MRNILKSTFISEISQSKTTPFLTLLAIIGGSILISLFAQVSIPLPFTPVPLTTQSMMVLLLGALLGRKAIFSVMGYLMQGAFGLPVFAGGSYGMLVLLGPTGGYLISYLFASYVVGLLMERAKERTPLNAFYAMGVGSLIIYLLGAARLSSFVGVEKAILLGVLPFLVGDLLKIFVGIRILKGLRWFR